MSEDTPSAAPQPRVRRDSKGRIVVAPTKTVREALEKSSISKTSWNLPDEISSPEELKKSNAAVVKRLNEIRAQFEGAPKGLDPTEDPSFLSVIRSELSVKNALYILTGSTTPPGQVATSDQEEFELPPGVDPGFAGSMAARSAIEQGLDLTGAMDDDLDQV